MKLPRRSKRLRDTIARAIDVKRFSPHDPTSVVDSDAAELLALYDQKRAWQFQGIGGDPRRVQCLAVVLVGVLVRFTFTVGPVQDSP